MKTGENRWDFLEDPSPRLAAKPANLVQNTGRESPQRKGLDRFFVFFRASGVPQWYFAVFEMQTTIFYEKT